MDAKVRQYTEAKVRELIRAYSCCAEAKAAGQAWLDAAGTDQEAEKTKALIAELEEDIIPIDGLIAFAGSEGGEKVFGAEKAKEVEAHARRQARSIVTARHAQPLQQSLRRKMRCWRNSLELLCLRVFTDKEEPLDGCNPFSGFFFQPEGQEPFC